MITKLKAHHFDYFQPQERQQIEYEALISSTSYTDFLIGGQSYAAIKHGTVICLAGFIPHTRHSALVWLILSNHANRHLFYITKEISDFLKSSCYNRIETPVLRSFKQGHRWLKMLGFVNETQCLGMRNYGYHQETYDLYSLCK